MLVLDGVRYRAQKYQQGDCLKYYIINQHTGEIVDDARGEGYANPSAAYKSFNYKYRNSSKQKKKRTHVH